MFVLDDVCSIVVEHTRRFLCGIVLNEVAGVGGLDVWGGDQSGSDAVGCLAEA